MSARPPGDCDTCPERLPAGQNRGYCPECLEVMRRLTKLHEDERQELKAYRVKKRAMVVEYAGRAERGEPLFG